MGEIDRYKENDWDSTNPFMQYDSDGDYVLYEDYLKVVQELKDCIWKLADDLEAARMEASGHG